MADKETELEWEKSKRIEAERVKAAEALNRNNGETKVNSAFLAPENTKIHGYSRDKNSISRSVEKAAGFSIGFVILGIITTSLPRAIAIAGAPAPLTILFDIISAIGMVILFAAPILAVVALWSNYYYKKNDKNIVITAGISLAIFAVYLIIHFAIIK
jgi:hypothetical protein